MYSKNHSLLYVSLFCVYPFLSRLDKSMMVPSLSPFPVLLKLKVVWGCYTAALFFLFFELVSAESRFFGGKKKILAVFIRFVFQVHISFSILFYYYR